MAVQKIYTLTDSEIEKFCNTEAVDIFNEPLGILGHSERMTNGISSWITKIEIYLHDETTKMYLLDGVEPTAFFALAYNEDDEPCWYYPVQAVSNVDYIPVLDEHGSWSWNLISGSVLQHITGNYRTVKLCDDGCLAYINTKKTSGRRRYQR